MNVICAVFSFGFVHFHIRPRQLNILLKVAATDEFVNE